ncbi:peptidylprolyl isomerase [Chryseobacterium carnipullorum]|uniref:peptidylprolyl isomerase n=1 Tax=Chryseobacterium carnipullorum TaxID=1124835 RepID=UPI000E7EE4E7|nr:peptidylprolyl isomerase [Chryseobacterium carnipullorum]HBV15256.1 peptidylprolyl isomerase [Chryseobacterium carnipullorum]
MKKILLGLTMLAAQLMFAQKVTGVKVEKVQKEVPAQLSKEKISLYNDNFLKFVTALKDSDRPAVDLLLSEKVKEIVTDDVLKKVKEGFDVNKKLEILKTGYHKLMDGSNLPSIHYKYAGDSSSKEVIMAVFEEDGKILGVMPAKKEK